MKKGPLSQPLKVALGWGHLNIGRQPAPTLTFSNSQEFSYPESYPVECSAIRSSCSQLSPWPSARRHEVAQALNLTIGAYVEPGGGGIHFDSLVS